MKEKQIPFNLQLPKEMLERLREKSKRTGIPVSALIKINLEEKSKEDGLNDR